MPPRTNESATAGPACLAAAVPVSTKKPAPMIAPIPSIVRLVAVSVRFRPPWLSLYSASALSASIDLRTQRLAIVTSPKTGAGDAGQPHRGGRPAGTGRCSPTGSRHPDGPEPFTSLRVGQLHHLDL